MKKQSIQEIRTYFESEPLSEDIVALYRDDGRKGVQALVNRYDRIQERQKKLESMHEEMTTYERQLHEKGYQLIAGVDEVGRGPLAGPVVAAACVLPRDFKLLGLTDSKKLTKAQREDFAAYIQDHAVCWQVASVDAEDIDDLNILQATKKAMINAITSLQDEVDYLLLDAIELSHPAPQTSLIKGDAKSVSIAASSVLAKVWRDHYMEKLAAKHPEYGFERNVGYGTKDHLEAIRRYGATSEHRRSFQPVATLEREAHGA
ncbi:ribonuclease HII [Shouchella shacheensis]|uniref:ribonuclease HII n=1 Tax=Shouchella shacheensis TaxID=1649580 RepID=UPI00074025E3|nr:ribonuclease HII [Shouchella shacheensis]